MITQYEQVYGLSLIWSEAKYNFAFWNINKDIDWNAFYLETLKKVMCPIDLTEYYLELSKFISKLNDGHTDITFPNAILQMLPIKIQHIDGKHYVTGISDNCQVPMLSEIISINGQDFNEYLIQKINQYCWKSNCSSSISRAYSFIPYIEKNDCLSLNTSCGEYKLYKVHNRKIAFKESKMKCYESTNEIYTSHGLKINLTKDKLAIITILNFYDFRIVYNFYSIIEKIKNCKGYIIDIRGNKGGNSNIANSIAKAFFEGEFIGGKVSHPIYIGAYKAWGNGMDFLTIDMNEPLNKKIYDICTYNYFEQEVIVVSSKGCPVSLKQPLVILINGDTASTAENFLMSFDIAKRATIVGEASAGTTGNSLDFNLPGGGRARICTRKFTYPDNKEFINIGIKPHIYLPLQLADLRNMTDAVLDKAIKILRNILEA